MGRYSVALSSLSPKPQSRFQDPITRLRIGRITVFQKQCGTGDEHAVARLICDLGHLAEERGFSFLSNVEGEAKIITKNLANTLGTHFESARLEQPPGAALPLFDTPNIIFVLCVTSSLEYRT